MKQLCNKERPTKAPEFHQQNGWGSRVRFMEVRMNGKGRKLFRSAVGILTSVMMMGAYTTTAMASGIGVIDAKDMLDIHAEANTASAVIGQIGRAHV